MIFAYLLAYNRYMNLLGILCVFLTAYIFSHKRAAINWRLVVKGLGLQLLIGVCFLKFSCGQQCIGVLAAGIAKMYQCADVGINFMFGNLADASGPWGMLFAVKVLPVLIFFGACIAVLFHIGLIQRVVTGVNAVVRPYLGTSGIETLSAITTCLLGQTEALFVVRHYLSSMTKAELFVVMASGMSAISATLLSVFSVLGISASHLLASVMMSIPSSIIMAKLIFPDTEQSSFDKNTHLDAPPVATSNVLEAIATGTGDGLRLALNIGAMLLAFLGLLALINYSIAAVCTYINACALYMQCAWQLPILTLDSIFSYLLAPVGYLLGLQGQEALAAGHLLGKKIAVNEFIAYSTLVKTELSARATTIMTYALCGFSNFSCIGIQLGSIGVLAPERRAWVAELGMYAVLSGVLSNLLTAMIAGLLL